MIRLSVKLGDVEIRFEQDTPETIHHAMTQAAESYNVVVTLREFVNEAIRLHHGKSGLGNNSNHHLSGHAAGDEHTGARESNGAGVVEHQQITAGGKSRPAHIGHGKEAA